MMKKEKGIALVSLIIVIIVMTIVASTVVYMSFDRFEVNNLRKMYNDIELLEDKVSNYYLKYGGLPVLRNNTNTPIQYTYTTLDFEKNSGDNSNYYILDLNAMEGISLNYGKEGFENPNASDDVYIINEESHIVYYVKGIELQGELQHYLNENVKIADNIPPSAPGIKVISGTKAGDIYTSDVQIEITSGKDNWSGVSGTQYSLDNGATWQEMSGNSQVISITKKGSYTIRAKTYDNATNKNYSSETQLNFEIDKVLVGTYINYDVPYTDMFSGIEYDNSAEGKYGWRYLGTDDDGNNLLISTAIPAIVNYNYLPGETLPTWWPTDSEVQADTAGIYKTTAGWDLNNSGEPNKYASYGLRYKFESIPFTWQESGTSVSAKNTGIFRQVGSATNGTNINLNFRASGVKVEGVHNLTLAELNRAVNSVNGNNNRAETSTSSGFKELTEEALGLFDMQDLTDYTANYYYWLASPDANSAQGVCNVYYNLAYVNNNRNYYYGVRPVVVLSPEVEFVKEDGVWKIAD